MLRPPCQSLLIARKLQLVPWQLAGGVAVRAGGWTWRAESRGEDLLRGGVLARIPVVPSVSEHPPHVFHNQGVGFLEIPGGIAPFPRTGGCALEIPRGVLLSRGCTPPNVRRRAYAHGCLLIPWPSERNGPGTRPWSQGSWPGEDPGSKDRTGAGDPGTGDRSGNRGPKGPGTPQGPKGPWTQGPGT